MIKIEELEQKRNLSIEDTYKLSDFIYNQIEDANYHFPKAQEEHLPSSIEIYKEICKNLTAIEVTSEIVESDYFDNQIQKVKTNLPHIIKSFN